MATLMAALAITFTRFDTDSAVKPALMRVAGP
eukprot:CAMPEP_0170056826 /NCGR_PEP_ID=MMETSP0019_2-20121128/79_1 /TAXON_ID=98059 /ORGANISM="Dinobryon sp., Strain UTEXLB2267" /LENGTH=31 /DNA_ID= /DNA_START= /DNA_END= /DNA_ORIENTATION=